MGSPNEFLIDAGALEWTATGEGAWIKVLHVDEGTGQWTALFKQAAGTFVPPHKHLGRAEFYVFEGRLDYRGGSAGPGHFGIEPLGAVHEKTSFPEETTYLLTAYGPLAMYADDGSIAYVLDHEAMKALLPG